MILKVLISFKETNSKDLVFNNVVIIKGFYINIILKTLIIKVKV